MSEPTASTPTGGDAPLSFRAAMDELEGILEVLHFGQSLQHFPDKRAALTANW